MHGLESRLEDVVLAFPQVVLEIDVFIEVPQGFDHYCDGKSNALKLKHSTYGLKQNNYNFNQKISNALKDRDISPYKTDSCSCASKNLILVAHVDNVLILAQRKHWQIFY